MRLTGRMNGKRTAWLAALAAGATLAIACGDPDPQEDQGGYVPPTASTSAATVSAAPSTVDPVGEHGPGMYEVGVGIAAGKWETRSSADGFGCYWSRRKDASGDPTGVIANGFITKNAPGIMQIQASDKFIEYTGDCRWRKTG